MRVLPPGVTAGLGLFCSRSGDRCPLGPPPPPRRSQATSHLALHNCRAEEANSELQRLSVFSPLSGSSDTGC